jgi:hypothetical protein
MTPKAIILAILLSCFLVGHNAIAQDLAHGGVVPLHKIPSVRWIDRVAGDMDKPGLPFVIRIHHDPGYIVLPHTHPEDENITVLKGSWSLGIGPRLKMSELKPMELGAFGFVPKNMQHFGYAKVETVLQVHGIGPFVNVPVDPAFELTDKGVLSKPSLVRPGVPTSSSPPDCFALKMGTRVRTARGEGVGVGGLCSPANQFTQYWIQKSNSERFWATLQDLKVP